MPHIDTLATARRLEQSGLPTEQARAVSEAIADAAREAQPDLSKLATKDDLLLLKQDFDAFKDEVKAFKDEVKRDLAALKEWVKEFVRAENQQTRAELRGDLRLQMVWFFVMLVGLFGAGLTLIRLLPWPPR